MTPAQRNTIIASMVAMGIGGGTYVFNVPDESPTCESATELVNNLLQTREDRELTPEEMAAVEVAESCVTPKVEESDPYAAFRAEFLDTPRGQRNSVIRRCAVEVLGGNTKTNRIECRAELAK